MSLISDITAVGGFLIGAFEQLVNAAGQRVPVDILPLPVGPVGDLIDPRGANQRMGADVVDDVIDALTGTKHQLDPQAARARRPLLATARIAGSSAGGTTTLEFDADAPGCDWAVQERAAAIVAVYVDGRYHSSVIVQHERTGAYGVTLGPLAPGLHDVELRAATDLVDPAVALPTVGALRAKQLTGEQAQIDAHAPVVELYNTNPGSLRSASANGVPVLMLPAVTRHADGSKTIEYRVLFTHEEGGTTDPDLLAHHGRAVDSEYCYRVTLDRDGTVTDERYQSAVHKWKRFTGTRENGRPVLRVCTPNHMFSERAHVNAGDLRERWSLATTPAISAEQSEYTTMLANPWTWQLMAKELRRGGNIASDDAHRGVREIADPTRYVYLEQLPQAVRDAAVAAGHIGLTLTDGRHVEVAAPAGMGKGYFARTAIELPKGVRSGDVRSITLKGVRSLVLDETTLLPRELELVAA
ncbi:MAG: hypothetical protein JWN72_320 [Thermoleophilia bacterium]|nr:hypothetical protein [Thermoleophilia bacterium]